MSWQRYFRKVTGGDRVVGASPPKPVFCRKCGEPLVDGYLVNGDGFDEVSGRPTRLIRRARLCRSQNRLLDGGSIYHYNRPAIDRANYHHDGVWEAMHEPLHLVWRESAPLDEVHA